jgi:hypothetical protein
MRLSFFATDFGEICLALHTDAPGLDALFPLSVLIGKHTGKGLSRTLGTSEKRKARSDGLKLALWKSC